MNKQDEAKQGSLNTTRSYCATHNGVWSGDTSFSDDFGIYTGLLDEVAAKKNKSVEVITGYAVDKGNKEDLVKGDIRYISGRIQTWASRPAVNRPDVYAAAAITDSELDALRDSDLLARGRAIAKLMVDNAGIVPGFVAALRQTEFDDNLDAFEAVMQMPQQKKDERATANAEMVEKLEEAFRFRRDMLAVSAKVFMESDSTFYRDFKNTLKIDRNSHSLLALKGEVRDKATGLGIKKLTVQIPALGIEKKTAAKGGFIFKSLPEGVYTVIFKMFGYVTQEQVIYVNSGVRADVEVEMVKVVNVPTTVQIRTFNGVSHLPLGGVTVMTLDGGFSIITNEFGIWNSGDGVDAGDFVFRAVKDGFEALEQAVHTEDNVANVVNLNLMPG